VKKHLLIVCIIFLFLSSIVAPISTGIKGETSVSDIDPLQDYYGCYNLEEIPENIRPLIFEVEENQNIPEGENIVVSQDSHEPLIGPPMDSAWPMYCHDTHHTGRSPYSTASNPYNEKWWFKQDSNDFVRGSPIIGDDNTIYFGAQDFYALYPNGTLKWKYTLGGYVSSAPTIDENGISYIGTVHHFGEGDHLYAIYPNGTLKWKFHVGDDIFSSPAIGDDGTIYFGSETDYIYALYQNGTLKWKYKTSVAVLSSPALGPDGTVYCGSHDTYLYALYPNNGSLKWKFNTGHWIRVSPCIADDGTIYCVSLDNNLYAVNPNGTLKWKTDVGAGTSPTIGQDGTIYCGYTKLYAINPSDGSVKWKFDVQGTIRGATPCSSVEGTIYFGTHIGDYDGGDIVAVNPDGTERWRERIANSYIDSAPAIGEDGSIYIGSSNGEFTGSGYINIGFLHAFGNLDSDAPSEPEINGPTNGNAKTRYEYTFNSTSPLGNDVYYYVDWGDWMYTGWQGPYASGEEITFSHSWRKSGGFTIRAKVKDTDNLWGPWGTFDVTIPRDKATDNILLLKLLEQFPLLKQILFSL